MKKNLFKKLVASVAALAMGAGLFATIPAQETKAAADGKETEIVLILSDSADVSKVLLDFEWGTDGCGFTCTGTADSTLGWGRDQYAFTKDSSDAKVYRTVVKGSMGESDWCDIQYVVVKSDGSNAGYKFKVTDNKTVWNENETLYFQIDVSDTSWGYVSASTVDPNAAKPSDIMKIIDAIGTVELTAESLAKIEAAELAYKNFEGDKTAVTNYDKLIEARAKYTELQAAEDAKYAGKLTIYVNVKATGWSKVCLYSWDRDNTKYFGAWPGNELTALKKNVGWYSCSFDISREAKVIFGNGQDGSSNQTENWEGIKAGTYWITLSEKASDGKYKVDAVSTKAPSDWKDEAAQEVETQEKPKETTTAAPVEKGDVVSKDEAAKIEKEAVVEGKPDDSTFKVTEIAADSDAFKAVKEAAKTGIKNRTYVAVDFKLLKGTETVQPNGDVKITMPVPEKLKSAKQVEVFRMGDDNKLVPLGKVDVTDSKITFTTNHFSTYVFAEVKTATTTGDVSPIFALLAVAAVAGAMVVASRKKTVRE